MKTTQRISSCLAMAAALAIIRLPILGGPMSWHERLLDPVTFLTALTLAGVALVLWPLGKQTTTET